VLVGVAEVLTLFLLPNGWPRRSLIGVEEEASTADALALFFCSLEGGHGHTCPSVWHLLE
jgi:hypothetical protein